MVCLDPRGPIQGAPQPTLEHPQAFIRFVVILGDQTEDCSTHCVAPMRNRAAVRPDEYPTVVRGRPHTHNATDRLYQLMGKILPSAPAAERDDRFDS